MAPKLSKENLDILNNAKDKMNRDIDSINAIKETFDPKDDTYKATTSALSYIESTLDLMGKSVKGGNAVTTIGTMVATLNSMKEDWQKTNTINIGNVLSLMSDLTALGSMIGSFNPLLKFGLGALSVALAGLALLVDDTNISLDDILSVFDSVKSDFDQILQFLLSDSPPLVSVSDITVKEDDGKAVFNIQVNNPTDTPMKLHIWTSDNSAVSNNATGDFVAVDETITIPVNKNNLSSGTLKNLEILKAKRSVG